MDKTHLTHENPKIAQRKKVALRRKYTNIKNSITQPTESGEGWEQFGDCYDFWPPMPEREFDYLYWGGQEEKSSHSVK